LQKKYHKEQLSTYEIAELCDVTAPTIQSWIEKHGIEKRSRSKAAEIRAEKYPHTTNAGAEALSRNRSIHPNIFTHKEKGYERIQCGVDKVQISHHRLLATLLVDDISDLENKHVHHEKNIPWLNHLDNLQVVSAKEHVRLHS